MARMFDKAQGQYLDIDPESPVPRTSEVRQQTAAIAELEDIIAKRDDRIAELEAVVEKLDKTADGVPLVPGMAIWVWTDDGLAEDVADNAYCCDHDLYPLHDTYSTEQAARDAAGDK